MEKADIAISFTLKELKVAIVTFEEYVTAAQSELSLEQVRESVRIVLQAAKLFARRMA